MDKEFCKIKKIARQTAYPQDNHKMINLSKLQYIIVSSTSETVIKLIFNFKEINVGESNYRNFGVIKLSRRKKRQ